MTRTSFVLEIILNGTNVLHNTQVCSLYYNLAHGENNGNWNLKKAWDESTCGSVLLLSSQAPTLLSEIKIKFIQLTIRIVHLENN